MMIWNLVLSVILLAILLNWFKSRRNSSKVLDNSSESVVEFSEADIKEVLFTLDERLARIETIVARIDKRYYTAKGKAQGGFDDNLDDGGVRPAGGLW